MLCNSDPFDFQTGREVPDMPRTGSFPPDTNGIAPIVP